MKRLMTVTLLGLAMIASAMALPAFAAPPPSGTAGTSGPPDNDLPGPRWPVNGYAPSDNDNAVLKWNEELLQAVRANPAASGPTVTSRMIGVLHTAMFDAWAPYDAVAVGVHSRIPRRPAGERTLENKQRAISYAAYTTLVDLFPGRASDLASQMAELGYDPADTSGVGAIGVQAAEAVLAFRHADGSNQQNGYADTTGYQPVNSWNEVTDPWKWQPLCVPLPAPGGACTGTVQQPLTPHWGGIDAFALDEATGLFNPPGIANPVAETALALTDTANLSDTEKAKAEYWADGPHSEFPPGHWAVLAQAVCRKRGQSLDDDVKLFFALGNAVMDAGIGAWKLKYEHDFVRPITAIREQYNGQLVTSWLGPYQGYGKVLGEQWKPYQAPGVVTPPFPEYISGHSTFSAAAHMVLVAFTGSDAFRAKTTIPAGSSLFEPRTASQQGTPAKDVVLSWNTFTAAADEAGWSRRWGGIHFKSGDEHGRALGKTIGWSVWNKAQTYVNGSGALMTR